ncbi:hypothetical protein [Curvivirga sp.]|uniref:hypothetical protein n=1 Tax=Curvivirga sp. TaxID=2856848 RepID=UPI003B5C7598
MSLVDSHVEYGCWITPDNVVQQEIPKLDQENTPCSVEKMHVHGDLYRAGFVEIRYSGGATMELWGVSEAIRRSREIWQALATSVKQVTLCTVSTNETKIDMLDHEIGFAFPAEMSDLENFLGLD